MRVPAVLLLLAATLLAAVACGPQPMASSTAQGGATATQAPASIAATATAAAARPPAAPNPTRTPIQEGPVAESTNVRSPSGRWLARAQYTSPFPRDDAEVYQLRLEVAQTKGSTRWIPLDETRPFGLGFTVPEIVGWSPDESTLYFAEREVADGCALFARWTGLYGVELATGRVEPVSEQGGVLSPDGRWLATADETGGEVALALLDPVAGDRSSFPLPVGESASRQAGDVTWAPDGASVLLVVAHAPCEEPGWSHEIFRVEIPGGEVTSLVGPDERRFRIASWGPEGAILTDFEGGQWLLDPSSGQVTER